MMESAQTQDKTGQNLETSTAASTTGTYTPSVTSPARSLRGDDEAPGNNTNTNTSSFSSKPCPGSTYIIGDITTGKAITLLGGEIVLAPPGVRGCSMWDCVETDGWLGFKSPVSGNFLGHNLKGVLVCDGEEHKRWENFVAREREEGGYVLLMTHWGGLRPVGTDAVGRLAKMDSLGSKAHIWKFRKVEY